MNAIASTSASTTRRLVRTSYRLRAQCHKPHARQSSTTATATPMPRMYRYYVDVHGQMFLYDTEPKNLTSCFKDARFLNFFTDRLCPNDPSPVPSSSSLPDPLPTDWHENPSIRWSSPTQAAQVAWSKGYKWISHCGNEWNFVKTAEYGTPVVFKELVDGQGLTWAGDRVCEFKPDRLRVCSQSGYLYHPSPRPHLSKWKKDPQRPSPYGSYSLLSSQLVLQHFADGLEMNDDGHGGSVHWQGRRYDVGVLEEGDV